MFICQIESFNPHKIAMSGQAFRFVCLDDKHVELVAMGKYLQISCLGDDKYAFSCQEDDFKNIWFDYFDLGRDYKAIHESIVPEDKYLKAAAEYGYGIRILKQETFECVISYIISQRRSIPSITTCVNRICEMCGSVCIGLSDEDKASGYFIKSKNDKYYAFPSPSKLMEFLNTYNDLPSLGLGYRLPYVREATNDFLSGKLSSDVFDNLTDDELYNVLTSMFGVGVKVANCVMLFSERRLGRFPIDVWIKRILDTYYAGNFDVSIYPDTAGIMQQFMFYYERLEQSHKM